ncbi:hypothetical protein CJF31_00005733 [Rutstroemia sp. NJR-2017a BVV2]|nr:hypothetical protein CJF31_00005733 [Rutstroemia sp. NJR-2017a BVV2]
MEDGSVVLGSGHIDYEDECPFNLLLPSGYKRLWGRYFLQQNLNSCFPFHTACLNILREVYHSHSDGFPENSVHTLLDIFKSIHYNTYAQCLAWEHSYYLEDILDSDLKKEGQNYGFQPEIVAANKDNVDVLTDPIAFDFRDERGGVWNRKYDRLPQSNSDASNHPKGEIASLHSLPPEILDLILYRLEFNDVQNLLHASPALYRRYKGDCRNLSSSFFESRFWVHSEFAFARSIRPSSDSWTDWFFRVRSELRRGSHRQALRNRRRIWKICFELTNLIHSLEDPNRTIYGDTVPPSRFYAPPNRLGSGVLWGEFVPMSLPQTPPSHSASCIVQTGLDREGCRETLSRYVSLAENSERQVTTITPSYIRLINRRLISGLIFGFGDGSCDRIGYITEEDDKHIASTITSSKEVWLVVSQAGFEAITTDAYPQSFLDALTPDHRRTVAVARWSLQDLVWVYLGLDAMKIVRIFLTARKRVHLDELLWSLPYPSSVLSMHQEDIDSLYEIQGASFVPASLHHVDQQALFAIKVYSSFSPAGINGIGFVQDTGVESLWGSSDESCSSIFFFDKTERLIGIRVYKIGARNISQLHSLGVISKSATTITCQTIDNPVSGIGKDSEEILLDQWLSYDGERSNPGVMYKSCIILGKQNYQSIQASISPAATKHRPAKQVSGLLFFSHDDPTHPEILGQWTGPGPLYRLKKGEQFIRFEASTTGRTAQQDPRRTQVEGIIVVTTNKIIRWSNAGMEVLEEESSIPQPHEKTATALVWEFNASADLVYCTYDTT